MIRAALFPFPFLYNDKCHKKLIELSAEKVRGQTHLEPQERGQGKVRDMIDWESRGCSVEEIRGDKR